MIVARPIVLALLLLARLPGDGMAQVAGEFTSYAIVQDDATLKIRGRIVRLFGIEIVDSRHSCDRTFRPIRCHTRAAVALDSKIQTFVRCQPQAQYRDRSIGAFCFVEQGGTTDSPVDLGAYLIRQGWAVARPEAPFIYHKYEEIARVNRRGVWGFQVDSIR